MDYAPGTFGVTRALKRSGQRKSCKRVSRVVGTSTYLLGLVVYEDRGRQKQSSIVEDERSGRDRR